MPQRDATLDWLRLGIVGGILPYHALRLFDAPAFYVKFPADPVTWEIIARLFDMFGMQALFFAAGAAAISARRRRDRGAFLTERARRLLLPATFGTLVLMPPVVWVAGGAERPFAEALAAMFPPGDLSGMDGRIGVGHLWFLVYLFGFSLIPFALPPQGASAPPAPIEVVLIPAAAAGLTHLLGLDYPSVPFFLVFFLAGLWIGPNGAVPRALARLRWPVLAATLALAALMIWGRLTALASGLPDAGASRAVLILFGFLWGAASWFCVLMALDLAAGAARRFGPVPRGWRDAAMAAYVGHMTTLVVSAGLIGPITGQPLVDYFVVLLMAAAALGVICLAALRLALLRPLFGLGPR